jgi:hypothetical protein
MARAQITEIRYFETYYFANIINNILREPFAYLRSLNDFFGDENYRNFLVPFPKISALHNFIIFIIDSINYDDLHEAEENKFKNSKKKLWIELALEHYNLEFDSFDNWLAGKEINRAEIIDDDIADYFRYLQLSGPYEQLLELVSEEIFFILFLNRETLQRFNELISHQIHERELDEIDDEDLPFFRANGVLRRVSIPKWVMRAVAHRDRGMCVSCHKDLTGQISIGSTGNFDHIVPLARGGINDVTNIQLLCEICNKSKHSKNINTSIKYEKWY